MTTPTVGGSSVAECIDRILNVWMLGTYSAQYNTLGSNVAADATVTEIACALPVGEIGDGSLVAVGSELMYVHARDSTNNRLEVVRAVRGTQLVAHAAGDAIDVNPRFPRFLVRHTMFEEVASWPDSLYAVQAFSADLAANVGVIDVPDFIHGFAPRHVIRVRRKSLSVADDRYRRTEGYETQWGYDDSATGAPTDTLPIPNNPIGQIVLECDISLSTSFQVVCACDFNSEYFNDYVIGGVLPNSEIATGENTDLAQNVGLSRGMFEILELGTAYRLLMGRGSVRLFPEAEGQSRNAAEVGGQDIPSLATRFYQMRSVAIAREGERLARRFGFGGT